VRQAWQSGGQLPPSSGDAGRGSSTKATAATGEAARIGGLGESVAYARSPAKPRTRAARADPFDAYIAAAPVDPGPRPPLKRQRGVDIPTCKGQGVAVELIN
jgi:hypothetical protein